MCDRLKQRLVCDKAGRRKSERSFWAPLGRRGCRKRWNPARCAVTGGPPLLDRTCAARNSPYPRRHSRSARHELGHGASLGQLSEDQYRPPCPGHSGRSSPRIAPNIKTKSQVLLRLAARPRSVTHIDGYPNFRIPVLQICTHPDPGVPAACVALGSQD